MSKSKLKEVWLKNFRRAVDTNILRASELCRDAAIARGQFDKYYSGKIFPGLDALERLSAALRVPLKDLLSEDAERAERRPVRDAMATMRELYGALELGDFDSPLVKEHLALVEELRAKKRTPRKKTPPQK